MDLRTLRVDQNGSLIRPAPVLDAFERHAHGRASDDELRAVQDQAIRAAIRRQEAIGLPVVIGWRVPAAQFPGKLRQGRVRLRRAGAGRDAHRLARAQSPLHRTEQNFDAAGPAITTRRPVTERLRFKHNVLLEEYRFASSVATRPVKVPSSAPTALRSASPRRNRKRSTSDIDEFIADVVAIERQMITELVAAGCRYMHIDAPGFTAYVDDVSLERMRAAARTRSVIIERGIAAENAVIAGFDGVIFGCISAAAIRVASTPPRARSCRNGTARDITIVSPNASSAASNTTACCSNTTASVRAISRRCASSPRTRSPCSAW